MPGRKTSECGPPGTTNTESISSRNFKMQSPCPPPQGNRILATRVYLCCPTGAKIQYPHAPMPPFPRAFPASSLRPEAAEPPLLDEAFRTCLVDGSDAETQWSTCTNGAQASPVAALPGECRSRSARDPRSRRPGAVRKTGSQHAIALSTASTGLAFLPRFFAPTSPGRHILSQRTETTDFVTKIAQMP